MKSETTFMGGYPMRHAISNALTGCIRLLHERTILLLTIMFCAGVAGVLWQVSRLQSDLVASVTVQHAALYSQALAEFRTLYTSEVVERVRGHGIDVTHDYATRARAIPLPATLSMLLGMSIGARGVYRAIFRSGGPHQATVSVSEAHLTGPRRNSIAL